jgi:hypothetical protein
MDGRLENYSEKKSSVQTTIMKTTSVTCAMTIVGNRKQDWQKFELYRSSPDSVKLSNIVGRPMVFCANSR